MVFIFMFVVLDRNGNKIFWMFGGLNKLMCLKVRRIIFGI